jgi:mevalonate kinase
MNGSGSASGKVILLGEHAVVYGIPALAAGLSSGATAEVELADADSILFSTSDAPDPAELSGDHELYAGLAAARAALGVASVRLRLQLNIPAGSGLGASAALGVATARALAQLRSSLHGGGAVSDAELGNAIDGWERVFHGNPSGVDAAAARGSRVLYFVKGREPEPIRLRRPLQLVVAVAEPPASTKVMVENVARLRAARPEAFDKVLVGIRALVENASLCLRAGDLVGLGRLMDLNQMLLASWMVSTHGIERACQTARRAGALGAKLTGSGGGGAIVALCGDHGDAVVSALRADGLTCFACAVGEESST